ncbi:30S ribosome-binding factor RbfA [Mycoplasma sp. OR1901]|uniref:30S ribosome-binding factor RbfA n=1 Tax=Mycoplasma sp. OR1901 TaxID=2742195 RepID=UPI001582497B|nr:30S ribosome-binding factor RbfA [Mycoplasma sp. OR1901]QKT05143.1 30S ribosome-binding factor RbfA [Mycoplasma sp. OR1901]
MNNINLKRKEALIRNMIADILFNEITNKNIIDPVVMDVELSSDLSYLKVYVNLFSNKEKGLIALNNSAGIVKRILAKRLNWRKVPSVKFYFDDVSSIGSRIDEVLLKIKSEENN